MPIDPRTPIYPKNAAAEHTFVTPMMLQVRQRILAAHQRRGQFVAVFGRSGVGKSKTNEWITENCNTDADGEIPDAFHAVAFTVPVIRKAGNPEKQALGALFDGVTGGSLDVRDYRWKTQRDIANLIAQHAQTNDVQLISIDEAGRMCSEALEGILLYLNIVTAAPYNLPTTIVLIGMHELPTIIRNVPQVETRVADAISMRPYTNAEAHALLRQVSPFFESLDPESPEGSDALRFVIKATGGLVRSMLQLVQRATRIATDVGEPLSLGCLEAVYLMKETDHLNAESDSKDGYRGSLDDDGDDDGLAGAVVSR